MYFKSHKTAIFYIYEHIVISVHKYLVVVKFQQNIGRSSRSQKFFQIAILKNVDRKKPVLESLF